jgi:acetoin utilization deacetylase AcuC-like enzyme
VRAYYSDRYVPELPRTHAFPMQKYAHLRERLIAEHTLRALDFAEPVPARRETILLAHTADYHDRFVAGQLTRQEQLRLGLPWSEQLVGRARVSVGGTVAAARAALEDGIAAHLGGGTHHAFASHGEGYCVFNDIAVAVRALRVAGRIRSAAVVDCDVHHGNGTAAIFAADPLTYTLSLHSARNYPAFKPPSTVDIAFPDRTPDVPYLAALEREIERLFTSFAPDIVFYQAGVDPYEDDRLGRLALTLGGLRRRDELVLSACWRRAVPCVITLGGGYARDVNDTVEAHCNTFRVACALAVGSEIRSAT